MAIVSHVFDYVVGVDTHARTHMFYIVEAATGARQTADQFPATAAGMKRA